MDNCLSGGTKVMTKLGMRLFSACRVISMRMCVVHVVFVGCVE